ncbi:hypothetical protein [Sphingobium lignivorans]|uniref:DUF2383 domain-containing protein n=1 Tax=Sphingobium lignivorans TaxID=2735886 RepID=A0ABR6NGI2_9SPHN|nr:hypothetical protein [Sphingobium lignivorans]MBB5986397.1 hypothetical protein [Sphingobium lignivorans]
MRNHDAMSAISGLATEFANVARLFAQAADLRAAQGAPEEVETLRRSSALRQRIADRLLAASDSAQGPAGGSWLPTPEEIEFGIKARLMGGRGTSALDAADQQLFARIDDLLTHGAPSRDTRETVEAAREMLSTDSRAIAKPSGLPHQPG